MVVVPVLDRMTWQTGIGPDARTAAAKHCQAALAAAGPKVPELRLTYFQDGTPSTEHNHIIVTMAWGQMFAGDLQPGTLALAWVR